MFAAEVLLSTQRNDLDSALETANAAAAIFADHAPTLVLAGKVRQAQGLTREAAEAYARALALEPTDVVACVGVGSTTAVLDSHEASVARLEACLELPGAESDANLAYVLGFEYLQAGNEVQAGATLARALELRPHDHRAAAARRATAE